MTFDIRKIKFPTYNGLESQYEHVVYTYLEEILGEIGYTIKIKKQNIKMLIRHYLHQAIKVAMLIFLIIKIQKI